MWMGILIFKMGMISLKDLETIQDDGCLSPSNSKSVDDVEIEISHKIWRFKLPLCISWCFNYLSCKVTSPSDQFVLACLTHPQVKRKSNAENLLFCMILYEFYNIVGKIGS